MTATTNYTKVIYISNVALICGALSAQINGYTNIFFLFSNGNSVTDLNMYMYYLELACKWSNEGELMNSYR